ncbi:MAG TPA: trimethylamine methyltransferase family protein [Anaerolineales bacterium]|nr:trimethylamine methyltransferase family protein [Anaerolineales bacterium]
MPALSKSYHQDDRPIYHRLSRAQCERIYAACLQILEETGVRLFDQEALDLLAKAGVKAEDGNRVRIPARLVEQARKTAPSKVTLYNRFGEPVMPVEGYRAFFGPGSDCLNIIDHRDNVRRAPTLDDVHAGVRVADALPNVDFVMSMFVPLELDQAVVDRYQMEALLNGTTKPIMFVTNEFSGCVDAVAMGEAVVGGPDALRAKPLIACYVNVTTGLIHNQEALQKLLFLAGRGLPAAYVPSTQGGATAPVTPVGALAVSQAGALAGLVLSQLKREGAPFIMPGWGGNMLDMRTTVQPYADPDKRLLAPDFVHWLGLPMFALGGCSDSKIVDGQAAAEAAMTLMSDALTGANIIHDLGYLESGLCYSLAQLVICDEILGWLDHFLAPVVVDDETLALDEIAKLAPDGQFLDSEHTLRHFRERWYPTLFDRNNYAGWQKRGGQNLQARAAARVEKLLREHQPEPLSPEVQAAVHRVVEKAVAAA